MELRAMLWMPNAAELLAYPILAFALRVAFGSYVVYMARGFYADPLAYFRKWMPRVPEYEWARKTIRALACFCIWGGCFIVATAIATQIFGFYGIVLAYALVTLAAVATYFLLPAQTVPPNTGAQSRIRRDSSLD